ncbi:hypothetical protein XA68_11964 [Ophiocordyceps unilateralis]|uniref:Uncharacterized protein n=1 Tax=Ophiocordyceps unilateralis TaxID=268505 RepID=A0A2A9PFA9_OPHUN|nr:hypothetical protein XA68_11964 [Ophiocordyceps unilateralis]
MLTRNVLLVFVGLMAALLQCAYAQDNGGEKGQVEVGGEDNSPKGGDDNSLGRPEEDGDKQEDGTPDKTGGDDDNKPEEDETKPDEEQTDEKAVDEIIADVCQPAGDIKLGDKSIKAPCSVQPVIEFVCEGLGNFINTDDGSARERGDQDMEMYTTCLLGNGSSYKQDVKGCISCQESNGFFSQEQATMAREVFDQAIEELSNNPDEIQTISEIVEKLVEGRETPPAPTERPEKPVELNEYYKDQPEVQDHGNLDRLIEEIDADDQPGNSTSTEGAVVSPTDGAAPVRTDQAGASSSLGTQEAPSATGAPGQPRAGAEGQPQASAAGQPAGRRSLSKRTLTRRGLQRRQQFQNMLQATFTCSKPPPFRGCFRPVQMPPPPPREQRQQAPKPPTETKLAVPTTLIRTTSAARAEVKASATSAVSRPVATSQVGQANFMMAFVFVSWRQVMQCKGNNVYTYSPVFAQPVPVQDSPVTPQKPLAPQQQKRLPNLNKCQKCVKEAVPIQEVTKAPIPAVTTKGDEVCKEVIQSVDNNGSNDLQMMILIALIPQAPAQPQVCNQCIAGGAPTVVEIPQSRQPAVVVPGAGSRAPVAAQPNTPPPNSQVTRPNSQPNTQPKANIQPPPARICQ